MSDDQSDFLTSLIEDMDDGSIPNFPQSLLFSTFVDPCGPALLLVGHMYFSTNLQGQERDPVEQVNWLRMYCPYFSPLAKSIQQIRNKLAHKAFLEGAMFKNFVRNLLAFYEKKTRAQQLVESLIERTEKILGAITKEKVVVPKIIEEKPEEIKRNVFYESGKVESLIPGQIYYLEDVKSNIELRQRIKGHKLLILTGKYAKKEIIFRSWCGTVFYAEFIDPDLKRKQLRNNQYMLLLD